LPPADQADFERLVARVRSSLGEALFATAWADGQAMTLADAAAYALEASGE
jgi:hypothetical protein